MYNFDLKKKPKKNSHIKRTQAETLPIPIHAISISFKQTECVYFFPLFTLHTLRSLNEDASFFWLSFVLGDGK